MFTLILLASCFILFVIFSLSFLSLPLFLCFSLFFSLSSPHCQGTIVHNVSHLRRRRPDPKYVVVIETFSSFVIAKTYLGLLNVLVLQNFITKSRIIPVIYFSTCLKNCGGPLHSSSGDPHAKSRNSI